MNGSVHAPLVKPDPVKALVLRWDGRTVRARCPYCLQSHRHGFPGLSDGASPKQHRRRSHCRETTLRRIYLLTFPHHFHDGSGWYGWEFDPAKHEFAAVNSAGRVECPIDDDGSDGRKLLPQFETLPGQLDASDDEYLAAATDGALTLDEHETREQPAPLEQSFEESMEELYQSTDWRRKSFFSDCVLRNLDGLKALADRYTDNFTGAQDSDGNTGFLLAAAEEESLPVLQWLQQKGAPVGHANHFGRTPLMEAALWGRLETVFYLIDLNVDVEARDANGMRALDLAANTPRNAKERLHRAGGVYREPANASQHRQQMYAHLERLSIEAPGRRPRPISLQRRAFFLRDANGDLEIYRPQLVLEVPGGQLQKAFATLDRGSGYPFVNAMSGYSHAGRPNVLENSIWSAKADAMRELMGLGRSRSFASHVEPQLLAYLVEHHMPRMTDLEARDREVLQTAQPPYDLAPVITVSKLEFCRHCDEFFREFKKHFPDAQVKFFFVGDSAQEPRVERT